MKFILTILICSQVGGTCLPPYKVPEKFDDGYDCMVTGYEMALDKIQDKIHCWLEETMAMEMSI